MVVVSEGRHGMLAALLQHDQHGTEAAKHAKLNVHTVHAVA